VESDEDEVEGVEAAPDFESEVEPGLDSGLPLELDSAGLPARLSVR
jgi:hypothetical protein